MKMRNKNGAGVLRKLSITGFALAAAWAVVGLAFMGGCPSGEPPSPNEVFMRAIAFDPPEITISVGESVTWTNKDVVPHTATSGNPGDEDLGATFRSSLLTLGRTFTHTFNEPGEFIYFCEVHPVMMRDAKVIVRE